MEQNIHIPNTFGLPATADRYIVVRSEAELLSLLGSGSLVQGPCLIVGGGSNIVFANHFCGTVVHIENKGIRLLGPASEAGGLLVEAAAGEVWDGFVNHCIDNRWHGAENLVAIPGTVGASPVQNVGAYGVEAKDIIHSVKAYEIATGRERVFTNAECEFAYRNSIFKQRLKDRYIVWSVTFRLRRDFAPNLGYKAVAEALAAAGVARPTARQLADTIAALRWSKLPRPEEMGSAGSFFKNPIVSADHYQRLKQEYPDIAAFAAEGGYKLAAGWMIEKTGWKGRSLGRCGVYERQALVLVNRGGCTGEEVAALARAVTEEVQARFGVALEKEAIII